MGRFIKHSLDPVHTGLWQAQDSKAFEDGCRPPEHVMKGHPGCCHPGVGLSPCRQNPTGVLAISSSPSGVALLHTHRSWAGTITAEEAPNNYILLCTGSSSDQTEAYYGRLARQETEHTSCSPGRQHRGEDCDPSAWHCMRVIIHTCCHDQH